MTLHLPLTVRAFAKINLTLRVLGSRPDGYHELRTVFQSIDQHDLLTFDLKPGPFTLTCDDPGCPTDERNLVWRAAQAVWRAAGRRGDMHGVRVSIEKRIPMQAGLGGGSSDAAAALRMLAAVWAPGLPNSELEALGATLGADVPFFFRGGTVLGVERGDRLFQLADLGRPWIVLAQPDFGVSTADAYRWFDEQAAAGDGRQPSGGTRRRQRGAGSGRSEATAGPFGEGGNDLEGPVVRHYPALGRLRSALWRQGATWAAMSGSGSVCFGLFPSKTAAGRAAAAVGSRTVRTWVTQAQTAADYGLAAAPFRAAVVSPGRVATRPGRVSGAVVRAPRPRPGQR